MDQDKICVCAKNIVNKKICKMYIHRHGIAYMYETKELTPILSPISFHEVCPAVHAK